MFSESVVERYEIPAEENSGYVTRLIPAMPYIWRECMGFLQRSSALIVSELLKWIYRIIYENFWTAYSKIKS